MADLPRVSITCVSSYGTRTPEIEVSAIGVRHYRVRGDIRMR
jgi:hypothetical protein